MGGDCFGQNEQMFVSVFARKGEKEETRGETRTGSGVVFTYLFHCVPAGCYSARSNNAGHFAPLDKDVSDLTTAAVASFGWLVCLLMLRSLSAPFHETLWKDES